MKRTEIRALFASAPADGASVTVCGWAKTVRDSKNIGFIELSDGSCFKPLQVVFEAAKLENYKDIAKAGVGTSLVVTGRVVLTPGAKQPLEVNADSIRVLGACPPEYPLQKKRHTVEFLRTMPHLRPRTNTFSAAFRVRSVAAYGIHKFLQENGFVYVHTPLITGSDCEGAGEMFRVTTLDAAQPPRTEEGAVDFSQDFFGRATNLTVSGQLEGEAMATAFGKISASLVADIIMPLIGCLIGGVDLSTLNITLQPAVMEGETVVKEAVVLGLGTFLTTIIDFLLIAFVVFLVVKAMNTAKAKLEKPAEPEPEKAPEPTKEELLLTEIRDLLKNK